MPAAPSPASWGAAPPKEPPTAAAAVAPSAFEADTVAFKGQLRGCFDKPSASPMAKLSTDDDTDKTRTSIKDMACILYESG
jgi:hypothetical protein